MRLTKDEFIKAVETLVEMNKTGEEICKVLDCGYEWIGDKWMNQYYDLVYSLCDFPEDGNDFISDLGYFCWELDFGRNWEEGVITDNGKDIRLQTAEDLCNYIMDKSTD